MSSTSAHTAAANAKPQQRKAQRVKRLINKPAKNSASALAALISSKHPKQQALLARANKMAKKAKLSGNDLAADELSHAFGSLELKCTGLPRLSSPVSGPGEWVPTSDFHGFKGIGSFTCSGCGHVWTSYHAYKAASRPDLGLQECMRCHVRSAPQQMWLNEQREPRSTIDGHDEEQRTSKGPHAKDLCRVCATLQAQTGRDQAQTRTQPMIFALLASHRISLS